MGLPIVEGVISVVKAVLDKVPDPKAKAEALQKLEELHQNGELAVIAGQVEINKIEAASTNVFIAGWRPYIGWVLGTGLAVMLVVGPLMAWGSALALRPIKQPDMPVEAIVALTTSLLGLSGMRSWEKFKGVESNR